MISTICWLQQVNVMSQSCQPPAVHLFVASGLNVEEQNNSELLFYHHPSQ